jgi:dipeptidyl aminopeptidase/acylaminoacyl peptidase
MSIAELKPVLLYQDETGFEFGDISDDKRFIAFQKNGATTADSDVHLVDLQTKEVKNITEHTGDVGNVPEAFDPESKHLYFHSNEGGEFLNVVRYELATGRREVVEKTNWDASLTGFSRNGKYRVLATNEDARTKVKLYEHATGKAIELPKLPDGDITGVNISDSETQMAFYHNGARSPNNLYVYDFGKKSFKKLTDSLSPDIDPADLVESRVIRYKSFDGLEIPAILYEPHGATAENKVPAIVLVHGGPGGQARMPYNATVQYLVNHGYVVLDVNNRGSSGYGRTFFTATTASTAVSRSGIASRRRSSSAR